MKMDIIRYSYNQTLQLLTFVTKNVYDLFIYQVFGKLWHKVGCMEYLVRLELTNNGLLV